MTNERPSSSPWRRFRDFFEKLMVSIIVALLAPGILAIRLWVARSFEYHNIHGGQIALYSVIVLGIYIVLIFIFKRLIYDPLIEHVGPNGLTRLRTMASIIIFAQFLVLLLISQLLLSHPVAADQKAMSVDRRAAVSVVDTLAESLDFDLPKDERQLLEDAVFFIDKSSTVRNKIADTCHSIDSYHVDIEWCGVSSTITHTFVGKTHNKNGCSSSGSVFNTIHWADMPCWQLREFIKVHDLARNGKDLEFDLKERRIVQEGQPDLTFYVGTISGVGRNFNLEEVVAWPCALWRKPDAVVVDCARFKLGIESVSASIVTDTGVTLAKVYKAVLDSNMRVTRIDKNIDLLDLSLQTRLPAKAKSSLFKMNMEIRDPDANAQYIFVIYKRDKERA